MHQEMETCWLFSLRTCHFGLGGFQQKPAAASKTVQSVCAFTNIGNYLPLTVTCHQHIFLRTVTVPCLLRIRAFRNQGVDPKSVLEICVFLIIIPSWSTWSLYWTWAGLCWDCYCKFILSLPNMWINKVWVNHRSGTFLQNKNLWNTSALVGTSVVFGRDSWAGSQNVANSLSRLLPCPKLFGPCAAFHRTSWRWLVSPLWMGNLEKGLASRM